MKIKQVLNSVNTKHTRRLLKGFYHKKGPGRKPLNPLAMLKAQLMKHLLRIPSDRRLALRLRHDRRTAKACGFKKQTPSHSLFTHFRHRLGEETYKRIFNQLLRGLLEDGGVKGTVIAVDSTHVDAYSQRAPDNRTGKSDPEARVGRGRRGFILGYRVHTACCVESEMPLAFTVAPCNENDKVYFKPLLEKVHSLGVKFKAVLADAQYNSAKVRAAAEAYGAEPVIPVRRDSRVKDALKVGRDFVTRGARRLVELFKGRWSVERLFGRAKEWLLLGCLRLRGLEQVAIHVCLCFTAMLAVAHAAVRCREPGLMRSIKHFTA
ncbi:MAG: transposase [Candidatus Bathyarchaeota archaeon]|nr:transposase [Candidatus Bathyarchaeota archaeon]